MGIPKIAYKMVIIFPYSVTGAVFPYLHIFGILKVDLEIFYPIVVMTDSVNMSALGNVHRSFTVDPSYPLCMKSTVEF